MKKIFFVIAILVFVATIVGCGKGESKYIGKYTSKEETFWDPSDWKNKTCRVVLEIKKDGTWETVTEYKIGGRWKVSSGSLGLDRPAGGEWKIGEGPEKDGIVLYHGKSRNPAMFGQIEGKNFINRFDGAVYFRSTAKEQAKPAEAPAAAATPTPPDAPAPAPTPTPAPPSPPAQPWTKYVSEKNPKNYLELKSNGNFFMQEGDKEVEGKYEVEADQITLKIGPTFEVRGKIHGKTIIFKNGDRYTKQEEGKLPPAKEEPKPAEAPVRLTPVPKR